MDSHPSTGTIHRVTCFAFVDDTDLVHVSKNPHVTTAQLIQEAQQALSKWEGLIRATDGDLAMEKSYWYLVDVRRVNGKWKFVRESQAPGKLYLRDGEVEIERLETNQARESLGIQCRPDAKMSDEFKYLHKRAGSGVMPCGRRK